MAITLCGQSAFSYYRTPPQLLTFYPALPEIPSNPNHGNLAKAAVVTDLIGTPLHRIVDKTGNVRCSKLYRSHFIQNELPPGALRETEHGFQVTSPAMTLLTMAGSISRTHLLMAAYELCGTFAVFNPCKRSEYLLQQAIQQRFIHPSDGWQRVVNVDGYGTNLWKRPPILTSGELKRFCTHAHGFHGIKKLEWAANHMTGETASPFEVETSLLLSLPRSAGGEGLTIRNNHRIQLSPAARSIYRRTSCYADILIEGKGDNAGMIIECQGRSVHASEAAGISDSNRTTALSSMGYEVILLTRDQITSKQAFETVLEIIARKTGIKRRSKTPRQQAAENALRHELFIDWSTLGS